VAPDPPKQADAAAGRDDRKNGSTSLLAGAARPEKRRRARRGALAGRRYSPWYPGIEATGTPSCPKSSATCAASPQPDKSSVGRTYTHERERGSGRAGGVGWRFRHCRAARHQHGSACQQRLSPQLMPWSSTGHGHRRETRNRGAFGSAVGLRQPRLIRCGEIRHLRRRIEPAR